MRKLFYSAIVICLLIPALVSAQSVRSIHQIEYEQYKSFAKMPSYFDPSGRDIIPINLEKTTALTSAVFGYLPYWEYQTARNYLQYELLSHIAAFDFSVSVTGAISNPDYWPWTDVINTAHENGVKVILTAVNFKADELHIILTDTTVRNTFFNNVKSKIIQYQLDGVNIDFESLHKEDRGSVLNSFMSDLTTFIKKEIPSAEISFAGPPVNWGGWDLTGLAQACDYIFIMGYNFYGSWSSTSGPGSPLTGGSYNMTTTVVVQYGEISRNNPEKLILGVPYYGIRWQTETGLAYSIATDHIDHPRYRTAIDESGTAGLEWDSRSNTPWYNYRENSSWRQVWFDTDQSLGVKYNLADTYKYKGVGMWALGYDGSKPDLWDELRSRYLISAIEQQAESKPPVQFELAQNYPNPFNSTTIINYKLLMTSFVDLSIYNVLGEKVKTLIFKNQPAGNYQVKWNAFNYAAGIYYYKIMAGKFSSIKKMILLR